MVSLTPASVAAIGAIEALGAEWDLTLEERAVLLGASARTFYRWREAPGRARLSRDQIDRASCLVSLYVELQTLLDLPSEANAWIRRPSPAYVNRTPLEVMLEGGFPAICDVTRYILGVAQP